MAEGLDARRILLSTDAVGGVWTYSLDLARELSAAGVASVLAVMGPPPEEARLATARAVGGVTTVLTGLPLDWLAASEGEVLSASRKLAALASNEGCDVVQLHSPTLAAAGNFRQPVVSVHHSCLATWWQAVHPGEAVPEDIRWRSALVARGLAESDAVVTPTTALAHALADAYGLAAPPLVIRNGRHMPPGATGLDAALRESFVLTSGRLWDRGKDATTLDAAAALLAIPVLAAGPVQAPSGAPATFRHLRLMGAVCEEEMRHWLAGAPVYASAARYEPFGLGVLEAAQAGCALVLSDIPSFRELWSGACLFVAPGDADGFARTIARLFEEPGLLQRMSARALGRARHYSAQTSARAMMRLYAGLIAIRNAGHGAAA